MEVAFQYNITYFTTNIVQSYLPNRTREKFSDIIVIVTNLKALVIQDKRTT